EVGAAIDPLSSDNIVIFANGPLTGTQAPSTGRTEITTKSPLTGIVGSGNTGGVWGAKLKHAGFDLIVKTPAEYEKWRRIVNHIVYFAEKYGKTIYGRHN
ncbi:MAG: hypothetical protein MUO27_01305, partial [Sedimentisphaerales bacterium]|nr:hypothetical protein [Sedimentisphaerales bacterium]